MAAHRTRDMAAAGYVLLDFYGTVVDYSPGWTVQGYHGSHALACSIGTSVGYAEFLTGWSAEYARFENRSTDDHREFSMEAIMAAFLARLLHREPAPAETAAMVGAYSREWNTGVRHPPGIAALIDVLADRFRLAIVSNTHEAAVVRDHLDAMGISHLFAAVVTSVEVGYRKPHPAIYAAALGQLETTAAHAVFVGDTYTADYVGPTAEGITAFLIDGAERHDVPAARRLRTLSELPAKLGVGTGGLIALNLAGDVNRSLRPTRPGSPWTYACPSSSFGLRRASLRRGSLRRGRLRRGRLRRARLRLAQLERCGPLACYSRRVTNPV
jgi:putative hydrolase of the HAD superfamily